MKDGLKDAHREAIIGVIAANDRVERAVLFGSRATRTNSVSSDVDIALFGDRLTLTDQARLAAALDEIPMAQSVDLILYASIDNRRLLEHIHRNGVEWYRRMGKMIACQEKPTPITYDWRTVELGDCVVVNDPTYSPTEAWPYINYLDTGNITENRVLEIQNLITGRDRLPSRARRKVLPGDIVYSTVRPNLRHFGLLKRVPTNFLASTGFAVMRGKDDFAHTDFIYWFLTQEKVVKYLQTIAEHSTSAYPSIRPADIQALSLDLPPLQEQRAIAHVLGTLDDKIELNRQMNATLEAMARALFRSWFVDFDPVRAKMEGRDTGLPRDIADLFPDRLVDSELGEIPQGWMVEGIAGHFEAVKGVSYKGSGLGRDGAPLHNLNSIHEGGGYKYEGIKFYSGDFAERHRVRPGDVIVANTEQGHDRLLIGYAAIVPDVFGGNGIASHHIYRLRPRPASWLTSRFMLFLLNSTRMHDLVSGYANGTTVNMLPIDGVQRPPMTVPPRALVNAFDIMALSSEHRREQIVRESRMLTVLRDMLLPKLVSGQVRVPVARSAAAATAAERRFRELAQKGSDT